MWPLIPNYNNLDGTSSVLSVRTYQKGSDSLSSTFGLTMSYTYLETAAGIYPADASASEMVAYLNALNTTGTMSVTRNSIAAGYEWLNTSVARLSMDLMWCGSSLGCY